MINVRIDLDLDAGKQDDCGSIAIAWHYFLGIEAVKVIFVERNYWSDLYLLTIGYVYLELFRLWVMLDWKLVYDWTIVIFACRSGVVFCRIGCFVFGLFSKDDSAWWLLCG